MGETTDNRPNNQEGQSFTAREFELIQELVRSRMEKNEELQYESFEGYELPPRTQFSMLKKPAVSIKYGQLTFNMAAIRLFEGVKHVLTVVNTEKKRLAVVPCAEEESASVEWARVNKQGKWVNKNISSVDFVENLYHLMGWNRECRYKVLGRVAASDRGLIQRKKNLLIRLQEKQKNVRLNIIRMPIKTVLDGHIQNMSNTVS